MVSEVIGRAVEFLALAFAIGLGLWMLTQVQFTATPDWTTGDGGSPDDGDGHHHGEGWEDHAGNGGGHGGNISGDGGGDAGH